MNTESVVSPTLSPVNHCENAQHKRQVFVSMLQKTYIIRFDRLAPYWRFVVLSANSITLGEVVDVGAAEVSPADATRVTVRWRLLVIPCCGLCVQQQY